ncbi:MAG: aminoacetone oxidase family FAD-binding enzyme [Bacteroidaceae bacterium]|nr:aminoacetone oxidase family FAD-binding enzyme [Bacteroidaceae bacterium]
MRTAVIGGGAAGFFLAINLKELCPQMEVTIFERSQHVLRKVKVSGGGRCNCTNTFQDMRDLAEVYPRGHRLMKRLLKGFSQHDAMNWFQQHGVRLTIQPDHCVFPASQDSQTIIDCFLREARRLRVDVCTCHHIESFDQLSNYDFVAVTVGGISSRSLQKLAATPGALIPQPVITPVPSLFTFSINDPQFHELMGTVVENATAFLPGTKFRASGPLLVTHWGMSGPAILKLSSYAARHLAACSYHAPLAVNWTSANEETVRQHLLSLAGRHPQKMATSIRPFDLPARLWNFLATRTGVTQKRLAELSRKDLNRLATILTADTYTIASRAPFKDEFVTCGGVDLASVNPVTLESKYRPHLYFAGEVLDIDGITGGFNFQAAWTTAHTIATAIAATANSSFLADTVL